MSRIITVDASMVPRLHAEFDKAADGLPVQTRPTLRETIRSVQIVDDVALPRVSFHVSGDDSLAEWLDQECRRHAVDALVYNVSLYMTWVAATIREQGWVPSRMMDLYGGYATWQSARKEMVAFDSGLGLYRTTIQDAVRAHGVLAWASKVVPSEDEDYLRGLRAIALASKLSGRLMPTAASMFIARQRHSEGVVLRAYSESRHFGHPGNRQAYRLVVDLIQENVSSGGKTWIVVFHDPDGNVAKWITSRVPYDWCIGQAVTVRATVRKHSEYHGIKQTYVARVKEVAP